MALTSDQQKAADVFYDFLFTDEAFLTISGKAGVGKTFLMQHLANNIMKLYTDHCTLLDVDPKFTSVIFSATTNKAAEVLERSVGTRVGTVHSTLNLVVEKDSATGKSWLRQRQKVNLHHTVLFIDEASMIDCDLFKIILEAGTPTTKVVFVGDQAQLAPVGEKLSQVFLHSSKTNFVHLEQPVRNAHSPALMDLCERFRETVNTGTFADIEEVPGTIEFLDQAQMEAAVISEFQQPTEKARILCYTNQRVQQYNQAIRNMRQLPDHFVEGELIVCARPYITKNLKVSVERTMEVIEVSDDTVMVPLFTRKGNKHEIECYKYTVKYPNLFDSLHHEINIPKSSKDFEEMVSSFRRKKEWSTIFQLEKLVGDFRQPDACTVYKSQGSTYETVFIDIGDIGTCHDREQLARMLFVAVSRASQKVCFYGNLPAHLL